MENKLMLEKFPLVKNSTKKESRKFFFPEKGTWNTEQPPKKGLKQGSLKIALLHTSQNARNLQYLEQFGIPYIVNPFETPIKWDENTKLLFVPYDFNSFEGLLNVSREFVEADIPILLVGSQNNCNFYSGIAAKAEIGHKKNSLPLKTTEFAEKLGMNQSLVYFIPNAKKVRLLRPLPKQLIPLAVGKTLKGVAAWIHFQLRTSGVIWDPTTILNLDSSIIKKEYGYSYGDPITNQIINYLML